MTTTPTPTTDDSSSPPQDKASAEPAPPRPSIAFLLIVTIVTLVLDLGSKHWVTTRLDQPSSYGRSVKIIDGVLSFISAKNRGGAWGLLQDESEAIRRPFFMIISAAAVLFIVTLYRRVTPEQTALKWGLPLVLGGAIGNLVDRIRYGYVVDFINVQVTKTFTWPTFNVADIAIVAGVALMAIDMFTSRKPAPSAAAPEADQADKTLESRRDAHRDEDAPAPPPADKA